MKLRGIFVDAHSAVKFIVGRTPFVNIAVSLLPIPRTRDTDFFNSLDYLFNIAKNDIILYVRRNNALI
jgi:hypothetical protein